MHNWTISSWTQVLIRIRRTNSPKTKTNRVSSYATAQFSERSNMLNLTNKLNKKFDIPAQKFVSEGCVDRSDW